MYVSQLLRQPGNILCAGYCVYLRSKFSNRQGHIQQVFVVRILGLYKPANNSEEIFL